MTAKELCESGGRLTSVAESLSTVWTSSAHSPDGFRFTNGKHLVRRLHGETWESVLGGLRLEICPADCSCYSMGDE